MMFATVERNWRSVPFDFFDFFNNQIEGQKSAYVLGSVVFYSFIYLFLWPILSVRRSVGWSVGWSVGRSVSHNFLGAKIIVPII